MGMPSQWSLLPADLLNSIQEQTVSYADKMRLRCVCASWRSQLPKLHDHPIGTRLPWLLVPFNDNLDSKVASKFYDPLEKKLYELDYLLEAEEKALFKGSRQGGWVVVAETGDEIYVVNPLTRARFQLPPRSKFPDVRKYRADKHDNEYLIREYRNFNRFFHDDATHVKNYFLQKIVLSPSTCDTDLIAVAIYGEVCRLAYCRCGDKKWSVLAEDKSYSDFIFHDQVSYAVSIAGRLVAFDFNINGSRPKPKRIEIVAPFPDSFVGRLYLVWCSGGIILVRRHAEFDDEALDNDDVPINVTLGFNIFKLDGTSDDGKGKWCEVESLGDPVLFLGLNSSTAFSCRDFPGCFKGNQIYWTDDNVYHVAKGSGRLFDQGVYSLDEKVSEHFPACISDTRQVWPAPIWIMPK